MRIRTAKVAIIPMWVIQHPDVKGNGTRIAVYAGLQAVSFEQPDMNWRSTRDIAAAVGEIIGIPAETCRKHLGALVLMGAIIKGDDEVSLPQDQPLGHDVGHQRPNDGSPATQSDDRTTTARKGLENTNAVGAHGSSPAGDGGKLQGFDEFWKTYPRKTGRGAAERAWPKAVRQVSIDELMVALAHRMQWWLRAGTPDDKIPHASTWLNGKRWLDEMEALPAAAAATDAKREQLRGERQRDEAEQFIAAGDWQSAWKIIVDRATASGDRDFAVLADWAVRRRSTHLVVHGGYSDERYDEIVAMLAAVQAAAQGAPQLTAMTGEPDDLRR